jgi:peptidoglycan hydrolase-like protein with peptidoglycan-binding domain
MRNKMNTQSDILLKTLPTLEQEDMGLAVAVLQRLLVFYGYLSNEQVNGVFSWTIDHAVRQFQHDHGLYTDGTVGHRTWTALMNLGAL